MRHQTYTDLVTDGDDDMIGRIAYSIYKGEKLSWIKSYEAANGKAPTEQEVFQNFHHAVPGKHDWYREEATRLMNDYIDINLKAKLFHYKWQLRDDHLIKTVNKGWWRSIVENVVAGFIGAAVVVTFNTAYWLYKQAPADTIPKAAAQALSANTQMPGEPSSSK